MTEALPACAVLLAGGRGTRFWPRSRTRTPKQLLNIVGRDTMLRSTVDRLRPLLSPRDLWVVTNDEQAAAVHRELPRLPAAHVLAEPVGRNTAAAIGLAAIHLVRAHGDALMAVLPSDHYISDAPRYRRLVRAALSLARTPGHLVVMGIPPTRPETGFGYIERGFTAVFLECGNVFLAGIHISRESPKIFTRDPRRARRAFEDNRHARLPQGLATHLSAP
jgi:mannose-1-phosphate guanylyltransferase